jgi:hypothetical protein
MARLKPRCRRHPGNSRSDDRHVVHRSPPD